MEKYARVMEAGYTIIIHVHVSVTKGAYTCKCTRRRVAYKCNRIRITSVIEEEYKCNGRGYKCNL